MSSAEPSQHGAVVVGIDGSDGARAALDVAVDEAAYRGLPLRAVLAYGGPDTWTTQEGGAPDARVLHDAAVRDAGAMLEAALEAKRSRGGPVPAANAEIHMGPAATVLLAHAEGAALLVVGHRGRGGLASRVIGSVGLSCVIHADCTVMVVRSIGAA